MLGKIAIPIPTPAAAGPVKNQFLVWEECGYPGSWHGCCRRGRAAEFAYDREIRRLGPVSWQKATPDNPSMLALLRNT